MEVAAAVASHDLQLTIDGLDEVGCRKVLSNRFGIFQKHQIVLPLFAKLRDPSRITLSEAITELFELMIGDVGIPTRLDRGPTLFELDGIGLGQMGSGVTLHVNRAELDIRGGKEAFA